MAELPENHRRLAIGKRRRAVVNTGGESIRRRIRDLCRWGICSLRIAENLPDFVMRGIAAKGRGGSNSPSLWSLFIIVSLERSYRGPSGFELSLSQNLRTLKSKSLPAQGHTGKTEIGRTRRLTARIDGAFGSDDRSAMLSNCSAAPPGCEASKFPSDKGREFSAALYAANSPSAIVIICLLL